MRVSQDSVQLVHEGGVLFKGEDSLEIGTEVWWIIDKQCGSVGVARTPTGAVGAAQKEGVDGSCGSGLGHDPLHLHLVEERRLGTTVHHLLF